MNSFYLQQHVHQVWMTSITQVDGCMLQQMEVDLMEAVVFGSSCGSYFAQFQVRAAAFPMGCVVDVDGTQLP